MKYDELLYHYQQELSFIRQLGKQFAAAHPKVAGRLEPKNNTVNDPFTARLSDSFALANARLKQTFNHESKGIHAQLNSTLYPQQQTCIPSASIIQFEPISSCLTNPEIPAGTTLESQLIQGQRCYFKTCYPVDLTPIRIIDTRLVANNNVPGSYSCFKVSLNLDSLKTDNELINLRFFINGTPQDAYRLYELIFNHCVDITVSSSSGSIPPFKLSNKALAPAGLGPTEGLLPTNNRSIFSYQLLQDFFVFPEKFLFFNLEANFADYKQQIAENENLIIYFHFNIRMPSLEKNLSKQCLALNCTPIINLFDLISEPFALTKQQSAYPLIPSIKDTDHIEIYEVKRIIALDDFEQEYFPLYSVNSLNSSPHYQINRMFANDENDKSSLYISFTTSENTRKENSIIYAHLTCTNGNLPERFLYSGQPFSLKLQEPNLNLAAINCLMPMTPAHHPRFDQQANGFPRVSLLEIKDSIKALCTLLKVFDFKQSDEYRNFRSALLSINSKEASKNKEGGRSILGTEITLTVDESKFSGSSLYLFGQILHHFFNYHTRLNFFIFLTIRNRQQEIYRYR